MPSGSTPRDASLIVCETRTAGIVRVLLNRPPANAFDLSLYEEFAAVLDSLASADPVPQCVQIGSAVDRFFSGGRDLKEPAPSDESAVVNRQATVTALYQRLYDFPTPVIAVIEGYALGTGCVIASMCDIRVASTGASFGLPEVRAGSIGGARHLMRLLPQGTVREMMFTGKAMGAARAHALGLVDMLAPPEDVWEAADQAAASICECDTEIVIRTKIAMNRSEGLPLWDGFAAELGEARRHALGRFGR